MVANDFKVSKESIPVLEPFRRLPLRDPRRAELFSFLAEAVADPNAVPFEEDDGQVRWTLLDHVGVAWCADFALSEIDVLRVW